MNGATKSDRARETFGWYNQRLRWDRPLSVPESELNSTATSVVHRSPTDVNDTNYLFGVVYPLVAAFASVFLLTTLVIAIVVAYRRRRRHKGDDEESTSILVYPAAGSAPPQFLTKEIRFSVPPIRSSSLSDLEDGSDTHSNDQDDNSLLLTPCTASPMKGGSSHTQRSHSFSSYGLGAIDPSLYIAGGCGEYDSEYGGWPDGHLGRVWFTLQYEPDVERLTVVVIKARNLPARTVATVNSCDPFVRLHLIPGERRHLQSKQKKKTCNPHFDESFVFQVPVKDMTDHILKLSVVDAGRTGRRAIIGHVTFLLRDLHFDTTGDEIKTEAQMYKLDLEKESIESVSDLGELLLSLVYNENLARLSVTVIEGRGLKVVEEGREVYVRVSLQRRRGASTSGRGVKVKRTHGTRRGQDGGAVFSECFNLRLPPASHDAASLVCHLLQRSSCGRDKLVGKCVLGSYMFARGKALAHWNTAFANPMQPVQQWHALAE